MTTIECPWCDGPLELEPAPAVEVACDACRIRVELAPDPAPVVLGAAA
jgi:hypothetical protein